MDPNTFDFPQSLGDGWAGAAVLDKCVMVRWILLAWPGREIDWSTKTSNIGGHSANTFSCIWKTVWSTNESTVWAAFEENTISKHWAVNTFQKWIGILTIFKDLKEQGLICDFINVTCSQSLSPTAKLQTEKLQTIQNSQPVLMWINEHEHEHELDL